MDDAPPLGRLHHVTAVASHAETTARFYGDVLGLHVVKGTSNAPEGASQSYFATSPDATPGGIIAFNVWPDAPDGRWGLGTTHHVAWLCEDASAQDRWKRWLVDHGVGVTGPYDRNYFRSIYFTDPDGLILEIATRGPGFAKDEAADALGTTVVLPPEEVTRGHRDEEAIAATMWPEPVQRLDDDMRLRSLHHVTCITDDDQRTDAFYTELLGLRRVKATVNYDNPSASHLYYANHAAEPGSTITFFGYTRETMRQGRLGTGVVNHVAYECDDDHGLAAWRKRLRGAGLRVTDVADGEAFRSIAFRDPAGINLEITVGGRT